MTDSASIDRLLAALSGTYEPNHWADVVEPALARDVEALDDDAWARLAEAVRRQPRELGVNLAKALRYRITERSSDLLSQLLRSSSPEAGLAAAQSLADRQQVWLPGVSIRAELERHAAGSDGEMRDRLRALAARAMS